MNASQRKIVMWTLIAAAVGLHFSFVNWEGTSFMNGMSDDLFAWFHANRSFVDQKVLCILAGVVAPVVLIGAGAFVGVGGRNLDVSPSQTKPENSKRES
jgi:hypothetical protein